MNKKVVIKLGGSSLSRPETLQELASLARGYQVDGYDVVVVHGGGPAINEELTRRGISWQFINGQRQTTPEMVSVIEEVLADKVNTHIVKALKAEGHIAVGLSGAKHKMLFCTQANAELMQVGKIEDISTSAIDYVVNEAQAIPVIAPIGYGKDGERYNINADWAAVKIAVALQADVLVFLTDQDGILDGNRNLVHQADPTMIHSMVADGTISGGMYTKVMTMLFGLSQGIGEVRVLNATCASQLISQPQMGTSLAYHNSVKEEVTHEQRI